jgi:acetyltransferase-like isoleucine patch superfamily enzyme
LRAQSSTASRHPEAKVDRRAIIETGGRLVIGKGTIVGPHAMLLAYGGEIVLGENCFVNPFCVLYGHGGLHIGNHVRIACWCRQIISLTIPASRSLGRV